MVSHQKASAAPVHHRDPLLDLSQWSSLPLAHYWSNQSEPGCNTRLTSMINATPSSFIIDLSLNWTIKYFACLIYSFVLKCFYSSTCSGHLKAPCCLGWLDKNVPKKCEETNEGNEKHTFCRSLNLGLSLEVGSNMIFSAFSSVKRIRHDEASTVNSKPNPNFNPLCVNSSLRNAPEFSRNAVKDVIESNQNTFIPHNRMNWWDEDDLCGWWCSSNLHILAMSYMPAYFSGALSATTEREKGACFMKRVFF